jgi:hypothetical protein
MTEIMLLWRFTQESWTFRSFRQTPSNISINLSFLHLHTDFILIYVYFACVVFVVFAIESRFVHLIISLTI